MSEAVLFGPVSNGTVHGLVEKVQMKLKCSLVPAYEIPAHYSVAFTRAEVLPSLLVLSALNTYSPGGVGRVLGGLRTCFGK